MPASFNGVPLGFVFSMSVAANPVARQVNAYPGAAGLEVINQGSRGGCTALSGAILAASTGDLAAREQSLRALQVDGGAYLLVDTLGTAWPGVILVAYQPQGRTYARAGGGYARKYQAEFLHVF